MSMGYTAVAGGRNLLGVLPLGGMLGLFSDEV